MAEILSHPRESGEVTSRLSILRLRDDARALYAWQSCERAGDTAAYDPDFLGVVGFHRRPHPALMTVSYELDLTPGVHPSAAPEIEPERRGDLVASCKEPLDEPLDAFRRRHVLQHVS